MSSRKRPQPEHGSPHELRLREIVNEFVSDDSQKQAYLAYSRELAMVQRHAPLCAGIPDYSPRRDSPRIPSQVPDYSEATKRVVQKWFERGLSGHLMWLIGEAILGEARMTKSE